MGRTGRLSSEPRLWWATRGFWGSKIQPSFANRSPTKRRAGRPILLRIRPASRGHQQTPTHTLVCRYEAPLQRLP
jgi:hypothetical protein